MKYAEEFIKNAFPLISDDSVKLIIKDAKNKILKKGDIFTENKKIPTKFYIIKSGIAREYIVDDKGRKITITLYIPPSTCGSLSALIQKTPSETICDCITDCHLIEFDFKKIKNYANKIQDIAILNVKILENIIVRINQRINQLTTLDATQRYLKLKKSVPNIDNLIQQYNIASYLCITPVQLSRIRKKIYSK